MAASQWEHRAAGWKKPQGPREAETRPGGHPTSEVPQEGSLRGDPNRTALLATPSPVGCPGRLSREAPGGCRSYEVLPTPISRAATEGPRHRRRLEPARRQTLSEPLCQGQVRLSRCLETVPASGQARRYAECSAASGKRINEFLLHPYPFRSQ